MATDLRRRQGGAGSAPPMDPLTELTNQLQSLFDGFPPDMGDGFIPLVDVEEMDDAYVVELELPGVKKEDINVEMSGRRLVVSGERKEKERKGIVRRRTRTVGRFQFEVILPGDVNEDGVDANVDHGVLTVRVPKADSDRRRRIDVS